MNGLQRFLIFSALALGSIWNSSTAGPPAPDRLIKDLKAPEGFELTLFAKPPEIQYPTCLSASPDGVVYVGVDENGSLDAQEGRGRIVRCVDADHDGKAESFTTFAKIDSPRGLVLWGERLFVLHPPFLSVLYDDDRDGVSDRSETLIKGIGRDLKFRGADHTVNGIRLGIDGYLYIAVGDYGILKAEGTDGKTLHLQGGGIVRVRPDGRGLELVSKGQRNIYDVAIDPFMNLFTRDNTNDGGGWDVRLSHVVPSADFGYPSLFKNFAKEIVAPLAEYGGGAPTGSIFLQEPLLPAPLNESLLTCDWGRGAVYRHPLESFGSTFKAGQEVFFQLPRPTDIDIDGSGNLYISSWHEGGYVYSGPDVGYVVRLRPIGLKSEPFSSLDRSTNEELVSCFRSGQIRRIEAQRLLLMKRDLEAVRLLEVLAASEKETKEARWGAVFTLGLLLGKDPEKPLLRLVEDPIVREAALRVLSDRSADGLEFSADPFVKGLTDADPRIRLVSTIGLGKFGKSEFASALLERTADSDPVIAHAAVQALRTIGEGSAGVCFHALKSDRKALIPGASRVLETIRSSVVVDRLLNQLRSTPSKESRVAILATLCRLAHREADYEGEWWGTRPDTSGPYFKAVDWGETDRIIGVLRDQLKEADPEVSRRLFELMIQNKVDQERMIPQAIAMAERDPAFVESAVTLMDAPPWLTSASMTFLGKVVENVNLPSAVRGQAAAALLRRVRQKGVRPILVQALGPISLADDPPSDLSSVWQEFRNDNTNVHEVETFAKLAEGSDAGQAILAYAVLLNSESDPRSKAEAQPILSKAWSTPEGATRLLTAIGRTGTLACAPDVRSRIEDADLTVRQAALSASKLLGLDKGESGPTIASLPFADVLLDIQKADGDTALGARLFERQKCSTCHTVKKGEVVKGPYLGDVATRYDKKELAESILKPSAKIAQGFETQKFATSGGETVEGFVVRESGTEVELRNGTGALTVLPKAEIEERGKSDVSMMPNGLVDPLTVKELASILAYLSSLKP